MKSGRSKKDFWYLLDRSKECMEKPGFSGSWIDLGEPGLTLMDSRENRFLLTELYSSAGHQERLYRIVPYEYRMEQESISTVKAIIDDLQGSGPPQNILDDERRLRSFTEGAARRIMLQRGLAGDPALMSRISSQYSTGYGALEHFLRDERVQDIYVDSPPDASPVYVSIGGMMDPELEGSYPTNLYLTSSELERIVSILRYHSDRPFSEAAPTLECEMGLYNARATAVGPPLSPAGTSLAIRKHSHDPWTLPSLILRGSITADAAAFLDLAIDGRCTMLVAGSRGAGKTSLLGALMFEVDRSQRIIVLEDTPELPSAQLRENGYKVLPLLFGESRGTTPEKALRTALRLGESVMVMGEVRGPETRILYEAMAAGTAGSSVMGTFHADSASAVFKRVVEDMGVPPGSFMSTDLIIVAGLVNPRGRKAKFRRVVQISEVVKSAKPGTFLDLYMYDAEKDALMPTDDLPKSGIVKRIASLWGCKPGSVMDEIVLRGRIMDRALGLHGAEEPPRPDLAYRISESYDRTREMALEKGFFEDHDAFERYWEKEFSGGD
jgi:flagellar protein FlaI